MSALGERTTLRFQLTADANALVMARGEFAAVGGRIHDIVKREDALYAAARLARAVIIGDRDVVVNSYTDGRTGKVDDPNAKRLLQQYDETLAALDAAIGGAA